MLRPGDLVYRVIEIDPPDASPVTWKVTSAIVKRASTKQITLKTYLPGLWNVRFEPNMLGQLFFETPLDAIQWFLASQRSEIETLERQRAHVERAITWATAQELNMLRSQPSRSSTDRASTSRG
jgi:hypothetical protein